MHCSCIVLLLTIAAVISVDDPPQPKISETFSSWYSHQLLSLRNGTHIVYEDEGYMVRDMQGAGRQVKNATFRSDNVFQHYSRLDLISKNVTYHTLWNKLNNGNKTCYKSDNPTISSLWAWIQKANYVGQASNMDVWAWNASLLNFTQVIMVPRYDPTIPIQVTTDSVSEYHSKDVYIDFNSKYQPVDSDFEIPSDCQLSDGDLPPPPPHLLHLFNQRISNGELSSTTQTI